MRWLKTKLAQARLSKDVSLRRKLIGVEYEKRYLASKKGWAHRRSADRAGVPSGLSLQAVSGKAAHPLRGDA